MEKRNKIILAIIAVVIVAAVTIAAVVTSKPKTGNNIVQSQQTTATEEPVVTPTFVYFISQKDTQYQAAVEVVEKLKTEYDGKINFDIRNVDEDPTIAQNFEIVMGKTPALIMLDTHNAPCDFVFSCADEAQLKASIKKALGE